MLKKVILLASAMIFVSFSSAWAVNPSDVFLNQKMDRAEAKLRQAEKASGIEQQKLLDAQMKMIKMNNKNMRKEMNELMKESKNMNGTTTMKQMISSMRRMDNYNLIMNKMMDQMIRDEMLLLEIIKKK